MASRSPWRRRWLFGIVAGSCIGLAVLGVRSLRPAPRSAAAPAGPGLCARGQDRAPCRTPGDVEALLRASDLEIEHAERTSAGRQNARLLTLVSRSRGERTRFRAKWRAISTAHGLNDPRKEIAAYEVQKLFLHPTDYVVPPAAAQCLDLDNYKRRVDARAAETFPRTGCVFGMLSYWLENTEPTDPVLDPERFQRDGLYRRTLGDTNLLLYLTSNGDTHPGQFVSAVGAAGRRVYFVDFTISLSNYRNPTLSFEEDWSNLHVPLVPESVERSRRISDDQIERLATIEHFERTGNRLVRRHPPAPDPETHADVGSWWSGEELRIGVTRAERDLLRARRDALLRRAQGTQPAASIRTQPNAGE